MYTNNQLTTSPRASSLHGPSTMVRTMLMLKSIFISPTSKPSSTSLGEPSSGFQS